MLRKARRSELWEHRCALRTAHPVHFASVCRCSEPLHAPVMISGGYMSLTLNKLPNTAWYQISDCLLMCLRSI